MVPDIRDDSIGVIHLLKHFDPLTKRKTLVPYNSQVTGDSSAATQQMADFFYYNGTVYGVGADSGTNKATVHTKGDFSSSTWGTTGNNAGAAGTLVSGVFVEYKGYGYGFYTNGNVWRYSTAGAAFVDNSTTIGSSATTGAVAGVVHSKDDSLYMASGNLVARNTVVTPGTDVWTTPALTLPSKYTITSMCEYGDYLAIACKPVSTGNSVVYLWDRNAGLTTLSSSIDFGFGDIKVIAQVEGELIGISTQVDTSLTMLQGKDKFIFRSYTSGSGAQIFREILSSGSGTVNTSVRIGQKFNSNRLYFLAEILIDSTVHNGVWAVAKNELGRWIVWFDRLPNNDTAVVSGGMRGFFVIATQVFISYEDSGYKLTQTTNNSSSFSGSSIIETEINEGMPLVDRTRLKQLKTISVSFAPLPTAGQVILKYKVDGGSFTTVFTETTDSQVTTEIGIDASGTEFTSGREYQFRIESTGGGEITELKYKYELLQTDQ